MQVAFGPHDFLEYNANYRLIICRECQYAIQKNALGSHLLRHKIYRGERQRLLTTIAQLEILEPDQVQVPDAGSPPVDGLTIISGFRCTAANCSSLYASDKRMRRHWSEIHGIRDPPESCGRPVNLQTFFRGLKLKYFEVESTTESQQQDLEVMTVPILGISTRSFAEFDLETIRYFHHFTTVTSLTFPHENQGSPKHWQLDVVEQALRLRWLMSGLLSISASHLASLSNDETTKQVHQKQSLEYFCQFSAGWKEIKQDAGLSKIADAKTGAQMICILRFCHCMTELPTAEEALQLELEPFQWQSFISSLQGCINADNVLRSIMDDETPEKVSDPTRDIEESDSTKIISANVPSKLLERLRSLPYRMAEALEKPNSVHDLMATLSAIDALGECFSLSFASDDKNSLWMSMESWWKRLPSHFIQLLRQRDSAALIVLAQWAVLVKRTEQEYWFLKGSAAKLVFHIKGELPPEGAVRSMVENLID
jgi:hypothetical protein